MALVLIVLLPKGDGGHRPIGLFPTVVRVWMKARAEVAREWEELTAGPELYGCRNMGAQKAAWLEAFGAEAATAGGNAHAAALLDLTKAFETVPHRYLIDAAVQHGFSLKVLRLSLAAYRVARVIGIDGVFSKPVIATRGITAGSGFATTELRLLLTELVHLLKKTWPLAMKLYVDDLTLAASGTSTKAANIVAEATDFAVDHLENKLGLTVSTKKSVALASSKKTLRVVLASCKTATLRPTSTTKLLGSGYTAGKRRTAKVIKDRIRKVKEAVPAVQALRRLGLSAVDYVRTAGIPQMLYGADVMGVADSVLDSAVRVSSHMVAPPTAGKNPFLVMHAMKVHSEAIDPRFVGNGAPINAWATAWWDNWATRKDLQSAFSMASAGAGTLGKVAWNSVKGPCKAVIATCQRIGWSSTDGRRFRDDVGATWDCALDPPEVINQAVKRSVRRANMDGVLKELSMAAPTSTDIPHHSAGTANLRRLGCRTHVCVDLSSYLRPLYKGGKRCLARSPMWDKDCAPYLTSAVTGGQWTQSRKTKLPGVDPAGLCQLCFAAKGTPEHRHTCATTMPPGGWTKPSTQVRNFTANLTDSRRKTLVERAMLTVSIPIADPQVETPAWQWMGRQPDPNADNLRWVIDGSRRYLT